MGRIRVVISRRVRHFRSVVVFDKSYVPFCSSFTILSALSLLLCLAVCVVWGRSYFVIERVGRFYYSPGVPNESHNLFLQANRGVVQLIDAGDPAENFSNVRWAWQRFPAHVESFGADEPPPLRALGIGWLQTRTALTGEMIWEVHVRLALLASVFALMTILLAWRPWRATRQRAGLCVTCGYDLRASPARCPECGTAVALRSEVNTQEEKRLALTFSRRW